MGLYIRLLPGVKVRVTKRGVRLGIGPRIARLWTEAGGSGVSTGAGPVSAYKSLRRKGRSKRRSPNG